MSRKHPNDGPSNSKASYDSGPVRDHRGGRSGIPKLTAWEQIRAGRRGYEGECYSWFEVACPFWKAGDEPRLQRRTCRRHHDRDGVCNTHGRFDRRRVMSGDHITARWGQFSNECTGASLRPPEPGSGNRAARVRLGV